MTSLNCCVENCAYNNHNCCCVGAIKIGGKQATYPARTCCDSFAEKDSAPTSCHTPNPQIDISCKATNCMYNYNCRCSAEHVDISGRFACICGETECSSFCCK